MFKKILLALALIIIVFLIVPLPFRHGNVFCETPPGKPARSCPNEGDIGWNSPLIIQLISSANSRLNNTTGQNVVNDKKIGDLNPISRIIDKDKDEPPKLKNIGFNLDYYNPATNRAGDFYFTQALARVLSGDPTYQKLIWSDYGIQDNRSPNDPTKRNVQPTFRLPLGTKVLSPIDGEVTRVDILYSKDYTIWFAENKNSTWSYEMEHVINPLVEVGGKVKAGQVVAEVSTHGSEHHPGFGILEIGLFHLLNNEPAHWCPFVHFDDSIRDEMNKKILSLYTAWETYLGDDSVYNNANYPVPGCATLEPSKG